MGNESAAPEKAEVLTRAGWQPDDKRREFPAAFAGRKSVSRYAKHLGTCIFPLERTLGGQRGFSIDKLQIVSSAINK